MKEFFQEIAKQKGIVLIIIGVILLIFGASSGIQIGQNAFAVNPAFQYIIMGVSGILILIGIILTVRENISDNSPLGNLSKLGKKEFLMPIDSFYSDSLAIKKGLSESTQISLLGYSLDRFLLAYKDEITKAILSGATARIMVINPKSKAVDLMLANSPKSEICGDIQRSIRYAARIASQSGASLKGRLEVRLMDWIPSCSLIITDPEKENGLIRLAIYTPHYKSPSDKRAHMILTPKNEKVWFDNYVEQFELLWSEATPYDLKAES